jgi:hypothetical protein
MLTGWTWSARSSVRISRRGWRARRRQRDTAASTKFDRDSSMRALAAPDAAKPRFNMR